MRTRSNLLLWSLLLVVPLASSPGAARADHHEGAEDIEIQTYAGGTEDGEQEVAEETERMGALSDMRWGSDNPVERAAGSLTVLGFEPLSLLDFRWMGIDRFPIGLDRIADLVILRPVVAGLGALSAVTYAIGVGPTLLANPDGHAAMRDQLLYSPWRFMRDRPLGEPMPVATEVAAQTAEVEIPID
jgi:hypothetical protein